jgi:NAD(P)-dependent dehydrogenase (short-subunit alcohol dehydrogenase family)
MINYLNKFSLNNKTAFVVGGLGLIGKEVSTAYAQAGANTIVLDIKESDGKKFEKEMKSNNYNLFFEKFNCTDLNNLDNEFAKIIKKYTPPNIFINCSYPHTKDWKNSSFKKIKLKSFRKNIDIHMNSYAWLARLAAEVMRRESNGGSIIQLGSTYGVVGQDLTVYEGTDIVENMAYSTIKGGITNLTRQMASYYGKYNIRVNTICPGGLEGHIAGRSKNQDPIFINQYNNKVPLKRLGSAQEVASTAIFLASDASSYITGTSIMVDGGWTII